MSLFKAIIMGVGFMGIGSEPAQLQLAFIYMLLSFITSRNIYNVVIQPKRDPKRYF